MSGRNRVTEGHRGWHNARIRNRIKTSAGAARCLRNAEWPVFGPAQPVLCRPGGPHGR